MRTSRKEPSFWFYPEQFLRETRILSLEERGVYFGLMCRLKPKGKERRQRLTPIQWSRVLFGQYEEVWPRILSLAEKRLCTLHVEGQFNGEDSIRIVLNKSDPFPMPDDWHSLRKEILVRDNYTCQYCGNHANTVDHIIARSRGGSHEKSNLQASCRGCNSQKKDRSLKEWLRLKG